MNKRFVNNENVKVKLVALCKNNLIDAFIQKISKLFTMTEKNLSN